MSSPITRAGTRPSVTSIAVSIIDRVKALHAKAVMAKVAPFGRLQTFGQMIGCCMVGQKPVESGLASGGRTPRSATACRPHRTRSWSASRLSLHSAPFRQAKTGYNSGFRCNPRILEKRKP